MKTVDKIFIINLDERKDRLEHFFEQCNIHNISTEKIERYSAINGKTHNFTKNELDMFKNAEFNVNILTPYIIKKKLMGNQLSHYNILLEMKNKGYDNILIFQDDVILKEGFIDYINKIINDIPNNAEIINIGMHQKAYYEDFLPYDLTINSIDNSFVDEQITEFVYRYKVWNSESGYRLNPASLAYIVTKKGCYNLLEHFNKNGFLYATDWNYNLYLQSKNIFYGSKYVLATGNNKFGSDIFVNTDNYLMEELIDINIHYIDKNTTHSYFGLYQELFEPIRKTAKNILEIGVGDFGSKNGGSILLWKLFFKNADIHAVDIISENRVYDLVLQDNKIKTYLETNAYDLNFVNNFKENNTFFDVIIDDGPHTFESQRNFIKLYSNLLTENGILVIEDIQDIEWVKKFKEETPDHLKKYIHVYDLRHIKNRYDDIVFVINKNIINDKENQMYNDINIPIVISYENEIINVNSLLFKKTLENNDWDFKFIGEGREWKGFNDKILGYYDELNTYHDDKVIILTDARDVFCLRNPCFLIDTTKTIIENKIIVSCELFLAGHMNWSDKQIDEALKKDKDFFWQGIPVDNYWNYYGKKDSLPIRKYLNSGLIIGKCKMLKQALKWIIDNDYTDDQLGFSNYANKFPELVHLDYDATYLHTSTTFVNGSLYNYDVQKIDSPTFTELFGLSAFFLHVPGITMCKGQKAVYDCLYKLFDTNMIKNMYSLYNVVPQDLNNFNKYFISNDT